MPTHPLPPNVPRTIVEFLEAGRSFALVTVLRDSGSTPRKAGTRMIVDAGGGVWGTIGGGLLESEARRAAAEALQTGRPSVFDFRFSGSSARGDDPVCGGLMRILIDPNPADHVQAYAAASESLRGRRRGTLTTLVRDRGARVLVRWQLDRSPLVAAGEPRYLANAPEKRIEFLFEPLTPAPLLLIAGGGHVGQALARHAALVGFDLAVVEDRAEFADPSRYPTSADVRHGRFADLVGQWPLDGDTYVAIVGRGHKVDADALAAVIHQPVAYVGMMGSRRKVALIRKEFVDSGLATEEQFARVHAPIGLDIGAETVEEIAASVVAELISVRRGKECRRGGEGQ